MARKAKPTKRKAGRPRLPEAEKAPRVQPMTGKQFAAWCDHMGLRDSDAARQLGTAPSTIARYRKDGGPALLGLACAAISAGLSSWGKPE